MMSSPAHTIYPEGVIGAPKHRHGHAAGANTGLPAGTEVFSADNHISVADDIFYERFPDDLKDQAPRIWYEDGAYLLGRPDSRSWSAISALSSCNTTIWPGRPPTTSTLGSVNWPKMVWTRSWPSPTRCWRCFTTQTRKFASGSFASTTNTSPTSRNAPTVTATVSV